MSDGGLSTQGSRRNSRCLRNCFSSASASSGHAGNLVVGKRRLAIRATSSPVVLSSPYSSSATAQLMCQFRPFTWFPRPCFRDKATAYSPPPPSTGARIETNTKRYATAGVGPTLRPLPLYHTHRSTPASFDRRWLALCRISANLGCLADREPEIDDHLVRKRPQKAVELAT